MLKGESQCSNIIGDWRWKNEQLNDCSAYCGGEGAVALVYREDNGNCACCENPPDLDSNSDARVYVLSGIRFFIVFILS